MRRSAVLVVCSVMSAAVLSLGAGPASAATVVCGDVIRADTTLTADLSCTGDGLLVLADVTLDLGGHTIGGAGTGTGVGFEDFNTGEQTLSARVRNGRITGFDTDIWASVYTTLDLDRVHLDHANVGLVVPENQTVTVTRSELVDNSYGLVGYGFGATISVSNSVISRNSSAATGSPLAQLTLTKVNVAGNGKVATCSQGALFINDSKVMGNSGGIDIFQCGFELVGSSYERNGAGITAQEGVQVSIRGSRLANNAGTVAVFADSSQTELVNDVFVGNGRGVVFTCSYGCDFSGETITGNRFVRNGGDGLALRDGGSFDVGNNVADRNTGWGLYADPTVTVTGTGNTAAGNGQPAQCSGVPCN